MLFKTKVNWFFMTDSYIWTLTRLKFEILFLSFDCLSAGETEATFTLSGKTSLETLSFTACANSSCRLFAAYVFT